MLSARHMNSTFSPPDPPHLSHRYLPNPWPPMDTAGREKKTVIRQCHEWLDALDQGKDGGRGEQRTIQMGCPIKERKEAPDGV